MKARQPQKGSERTEEEEGAATASRKRRRRNRQHPYSIHALINSKPSGEYNPYLIKKKREFYKNAKFVGKYKKTLKKQNEPASNLPTAAQFEDAVRQETKPDKTVTMKWKKNKNSLERVREEYEKRQEEEQKLREEREAAIQAKREEREMADARRKELRGKMFKRTQRGQPIMKYRIQHLLEGIGKHMN